MIPAALALLALPLAGAADAPVLLRYQLRSGQSLVYRTDYRQHLRLVKPKGKLGNLDVRTDYDMDIGQKVVGLEPGPEYTIEARPQRVKIKVAGPMSRSASKLTDLLRRITLRVKMDARGRVRELSERGKAPKSLQRMVGSLKNTLGRLLPLLPETPQRVGDTWRSQVKLPVPLPTGDKLEAVLTTDYQLRGFARVDGHTCAVLGMRLHLGMGGLMGHAKSRVSVTGRGSGHGVAYFDLARGLLISTGIAVSSESRFRSATVHLDQFSDIQMWTTLKEKKQ